MAEPIDFYFDFYSPYGYLASLRIDAIAERHGRRVNWRPFLLGPAFKATGHRPLAHTPLMGEYVERDFVRSARLQGVKIRFPEIFPAAALAPARAYYWLLERDPQQAHTLAKRVYHAIFAEGRDGTSADLVVELSADLEVDPETLRQSMQDPAVKERLKQETAQALERGVFGSPFIIVDGEPFWGNDRLDQVDLWLERGGW